MKEAVEQERNLQEDVCAEKASALPAQEDLSLRQTSEIIGRWIETEEGMRRDENAQLIRRLTTGEEGRFHKLATAEAGWSALYRDPTDGRLWEKTFPKSELHGGGPPVLRVLPEGDAQAKYGSGAFAPTTP